MKQLRYILEAFLLHLAFLFFRIMPVDAASNIGGWLGKMIGPHLDASQTALRNLNEALPSLEAKEQQKIITGMWENLGRVIAEYPHLEYIARERTKITGQKHLDDLFESGQAAVFFAAHLGNWEILGPTMLLHYSRPLDITYRAPNNPWSAKLIHRVRTLKGRITGYAKSRQGGKDMLEAIKQKRYLGILIDQKYNEGLAVLFFNKPAMTNPIFVQLCQKYKCPLIPARSTRHGGANFTITIHEPLKLTSEDNKSLPIEDVIADAHHYLETWIKENPEQWLWLHKRWDSKKLQS